MVMRRRPENITPRQARSKEPSKYAGESPSLVLHVVAALSAQFGGPAISLRSLTPVLAEHGFDSTIVTTDEDNLHTSLDVLVGEPIKHGRATEIFFPRNSRMFRFSWPMTKWLGRNLRSYDLVHVHGVWTYPNVMACVIARTAAVPYIIRPAGSWMQWGMTNRRPLLKRLAWPFLNRFIIKGAACVHYTTEAEWREAMTLGARGQAYIVPQGVSLADFDADLSCEEYSVPQHTENEIRLLYLGRLNEKKGLELLLRAFALANSKVSTLRLMLLGDGKQLYVKSLKNLAHSLKLEESVEFAGLITGMKKIAFLKSADIFLQPSYSENFSVATVEGMAAGLPVIIAEGVAIAPEVREAGAGMIVEPDVVKLAEAICQMGTDKMLRMNMGEKARVLAFDKFSTERCAAGIEKMYYAAMRSNLRQPRPA